MKFEELFNEEMIDSGGLKENKNKMVKKHLYTFNNANIKYHGIFYVSDDGFLYRKKNDKDGTPFEDYGDAMLFVNKISKEEAFDKWLKSE